MNSSRSIVCFLICSFTLLLAMPTQCSTIPAPTIADAVKKCVAGSRGACEFLEDHCRGGRGDRGSCEGFLYSMCERGDRHACREFSDYTKSYRTNGGNTATQPRTNSGNTATPSQNRSAAASKAGSSNSCWTAWRSCNSTCRIYVAGKGDKYSKCTAQCETDKTGCLSR